MYQSADIRSGVPTLKYIIANNKTVVHLQTICCEKCYRDKFLNNCYKKIDIIYNFVLRNSQRKLQKTTKFATQFQSFGKKSYEKIKEIKFPPYKSSVLRFLEERSEISLKFPTLWKVQFTWYYYACNSKNNADYQNSPKTMLKRSRRRIPHVVHDLWSQ